MRVVSEPLDGSSRIKSALLGLQRFFSGHLSKRCPRTSEDTRAAAYLSEDPHPSGSSFHTQHCSQYSRHESQPIISQNSLKPLRFKKQ